ncbi:MAG: heme NO-binding domain-containing protein [Saprospiraceae bacterium]
MKGVVFTEFFDLVEEKFGYEMVDKIIGESQLESGGVYTSVGTYDHREMGQLVGRLSQHSGVQQSDLLKAFGHHLFGVFQKNYGIFFQNASTAFDFLSGIEHYIHVEVKKLYPDAELPRFDVVRDGDQRMEMVYRSERSMSDLALGLIEATLLHYKEEADIERAFMDEAGTEVRFILQKTV